MIDEDKGELLKQVHGDLLNFIKKKYPSLNESLNTDELELILRQPIPFDPSDEKIKYLVNGIFVVFLKPSIYQSCTQLYVLIRQFVKSFREFDKLLDLRKIWMGENDINALRLSIPDIEILLLRDLGSASFRVGQKYAVLGDRGEKAYYSLGDLNFLLQSAKQELMDIFYEVSAKYSVNVPFQMQSFTSSHEGMPLL